MFIFIFTFVTPMLQLYNTMERHLGKKNGSFELKASHKSPLKTLSSGEADKLMKGISANLPRKHNNVKRPWICAINRRLCLYRILSLSTCR